MASLSYQLQQGSSSLELLAEFFYTDLQNPFANEIGAPDANGRVAYTRVNEEEGAKVQGVNLEATWLPSAKWRLNGSFTLQQSTYGAARSEEHTSELQSRPHLVCRLLLEKKKKQKKKKIRTMAKQKQ